MKKILFSTIQIVLILTVLFSLNSCNNDKRNLKSETYKVSIKLVEKMSETYNMMNDISFTTKYNKEIISILNTKSNNSETTESLEYTGNTQTKLLALAALKKVYLRYDSSTDKTFKLADSDLNITIENACNLLKELNISEDVNLNIEKILKFIESNSFDENIVIQLLTEQYIEMWATDTQIWQLLMNKNYKEFSNGIDSISNEVFNEEKLTKFVYEPYQGKDILVNIYKLNLKDEAYKDKTNIIKNLNDIIWGLDIINQINSEYIKHEPDLKFVEKNVDGLNDYLFVEKKVEK